MARPDLRRQLSSLTEFLQAHRPLWSERPFIIEEPSWSRREPALTRWLMELSPAAVDALEQDPEAMERETPAPLNDLALAARELCAVPDLSPPDFVPDLPPRLAWEVPARKRHQVAALAAASARWLPSELALVDWCAGKGYLGRTLAGMFQRQVTCLERREDLCEKGAALDRRARVECGWLSQDIAQPEAWSALEGKGVVALHACGVLHRDLVTKAPAHGAKALAFAPCCFHRMTAGGPVSPRPARDGSLPPPPRHPTYSPLSKGGHALDLRLDQHALRLPASREVVARPRHTRMRHREQLFRLGLDLLQQAGAPAGTYTPMPPFPAKWIRLSFNEFIQKVSEAYGLGLSLEGLDPVLLQAGSRLEQARAFGLVRGLFRRPLELWLVLDAALALQEQGMQVRLGTFCPARFTPRNLLVVAT